MVKHLRGRSPGFVLEAVAERMRRRVGGELARDHRERLIERHIGLDNERRGVSLGEQRHGEPVGTARLDRDPRRGTKVEQSIGRRRLGRVRGPFDGDPGELLLETGRATDAPVERIARRLPPRQSRGRWHRRGVACELARRRRDSLGGVLEATPVATHPFGAPALARQQLCRDQRVERGVEAALAVGRGRRPEGRCESSRRLDTRHPDAETREGPPGRREEFDERHEDHGIAPRH
jgi:hypothetical protein